MARRHFAVVLAFNLLLQAFCLPADLRLRRGSVDNELDPVDDILGGNSVPVAVGDIKVEAPMNPAATLPPAPPASYEARMRELQLATRSSEDEDEDDDFEFEPMNTAQTTGGGGSSIFSLLNLASALFPGSSGGNAGGSSASGSSSSGSSSPLWTLKLDILRALFTFATSIFASTFSASSGSNGN